MLLSDSALEAKATIELEGSMLRVVIQKDGENPKIRKLSFDAFMFELTREVSICSLIRCAERITNSLPS